MENNFTVYAYMNLSEGKDLGKFYVGQTKHSPKKRAGKNGIKYNKCSYFWNAIQKYGWDAFGLITIKTGLSKEEADRLETFYIRMFQSDDPEYGYNITAGGHNTAYNPKIAKGIAIFDTTGKRIASFRTVTEAADYLHTTVGSISTNATSKTGTIMSHICRYVEDVGDLQQLPKEQIYHAHENRSALKPVCAYDLEGQFAGRFHSVSGASKSLGIRAADISSVLSGRRNLAHNYQFRYDNGSDENIAPARKRGELSHGSSHYAAKPIVQYDPVTLSEIARYPTTIAAANAIGSGSSCLFRALHGQAKTAKGFIWRFADDAPPTTPVFIQAMTHSNNTCRKPRPVWMIDPHTKERLKWFPNMCAAAREVHCSNAAIYHACLDSHLTAGYKWEFDD